MKYLVGMIALLSVGMANAAQVKTAELSYDGKFLILGTVHGGGCGTHEFSLDRASCNRMVPSTCTVQLKHVSDDPCEALIGSTVVIDLVKERLYSPQPGSVIRILGSNNSEVSVTQGR